MIQPETLRDALDRMKDPIALEHDRWAALAVVLAVLLEGDGHDLDELITYVEDD